MATNLRDFVAGKVAKFRPTLFYYKSDKDSREGLTVRATSSYIDVVNEAEAKKIRISRTNAVYMVDMINSFEYYFNSAAAISVRENGKTYSVVDFSTPRFQMVAGFEDFPVMCPSLTEPFITAQQYIDFAELKSGDVVLDLGSYSGLTSIAFSKIVQSQGKVVAMEPDPSNFAAAQTNFAMHRRLNGLDNIALLQAAVSEKAGYLELSSEGAMGSAIASVVGSYRGQVVRVESLSLMDIVKRFDLPKVDFIKMDIEGSEEPVLKGAAEFFRTFRPRVIIEPHPVNGEMSSGPVVQLLQQYGYRCNTIEQIGVSLPLITGVPEGVH